MADAAKPAAKGPPTAIKRDAAKARALPTPSSGSVSPSTPAAKPAAGASASSGTASKASPTTTPAAKPTPAPKSAAATKAPPATAPTTAAAPVKPSPAAAPVPTSSPAAKTEPSATRTPPAVASKPADTLAPPKELPPRKTSPRPAPKPLSRTEALNGNASGTGSATPAAPAGHKRKSVDNKRKSLGRRRPQFGNLSGEDYKETPGKAKNQTRGRYDADAMSENDKASASSAASNASDGANAGASASGSDGRKKPPPRPTRAAPEKRPDLAARPRGNTAPGDQRDETEKPKPAAVAAPVNSATLPRSFVTGRSNSLAGDHQAFVRVKWPEREAVKTLGVNLTDTIGQVLEAAMKKLFVPMDDRSKYGLVMPKAGTPGTVLGNPNQTLADLGVTAVGVELLLRQLTGAPIPPDPNQVAAKKEAEVVVRTMRKSELRSGKNADVLKEFLDETKKSLVAKEKLRAGLVTLPGTYEEGSSERKEVEKQIEMCEKEILKLRAQEMELERILGVQFTAVSSSPDQMRMRLATCRKGLNKLQQKRANLAAEVEGGGGAGGNKEKAAELAALDKDISLFSTRTNEIESNLASAPPEAARPSGAGASSTAKNTSAPAANNDADLDNDPNWFKVRALYAYTSLLDEELSFEEGDILRVRIDPDDVAWYQGSLNGERGKVPCNYVVIDNGAPKPAPAPESSGGTEALAIYDYEARTAEELSINVGEQLNVIEMYDADWWQVERNGVFGIVPASYLELVIPLIS